MDENKNKQEKRSFEELKQEAIEWVKAHKKELITIGLSAAAVICSILFAKNNVELESIFNKIKIKTSKTTTVCDLSEFKSVKSQNIVPDLPSSVSKIITHSSKSPHTRSAHLRNLPNGHHPSLKKLEEAFNNGISLGENQTFVNEAQIGA